MRKPPFNLDDLNWIERGVIQAGGPAQMCKSMNCSRMTLHKIRKLEHVDDRWLPGFVEASGVNPALLRPDLAKLFFDWGLP